MRLSTVLRAAAVVAALGMLAGCTPGGAAGGRGTSTASGTPSASGTAYSAADLASIVSKVNTSLGLGGSVIDNAAAKNAAGQVGGLGALTQQLGSVTIEPAECKQLITDSLGKAPQASDAVAAMLTYGTNALVVTAPGAKGWPSDLRENLTSKSDDTIARCGDMTLTAAGHTVKLTMTKSDAKTDAEITQGFHESVTLAGAKQEIGSADVVQALQGDLYIMVTESSSQLAGSTPAPATAAQIVNAVLDAAKK